VNHEALQDHVDRMHLSGTGAVFEAYRELIEEVASEAHAAERPFDAHARILVTSEALAAGNTQCLVFGRAVPTMKI
jgi:hypothetical protein